MHCHICDRQLTPDEIKHNPKYGRGNFDPCNSCLIEVSEVFGEKNDRDIEIESLVEEYLGVD